jgi:tetratricopeptide (TPR) repeat protein
VTVDELLCEYDQAPTWAEAQSALDRIPRAAHHPEVELGELYDEVATNLADEDDFEGAARAQRQALDEGCKYPELGREMLAWYVLKAGRREEAEGLLAELRRERPRDAELELLVGSAFSDAGDGEAALAAFDRALVLARAAGNLQTARRARAEREWTRRELGLEPDADDRAARREQREVQRALSGDGAVALAFFARDQHKAALSRWPELLPDLGDPDVYFRSIEQRLADLFEERARRPLLSALDVEGLAAYAGSRGLDADSGAARAGYAAELARSGRARSWPPGRNEQCWCASARKYKRCCGS